MIELWGKSDNLPLSTSVKQCFSEYIPLIAEGDNIPIQ
ncbi:hypothetical protein RintRC_5103 [Richelia intracellularis]|nr:hypothetical protein RintRC_5103 [Richelia intracellularis]